MTNPYNIRSHVDTSGWRDFSELPDEGQRVLVVEEGKTPRVAAWDKVYDLEGKGFAVVWTDVWTVTVIKHPTAWTYLPAI